MNLLLTLLIFPLPIVLFPWKQWKVKARDNIGGGRLFSN